MTPLLGTKNPSAPVGDKSGGERRAARSLLSCALWRGMGRLWRGMGGMGRPEPLSAHRPRRQQRLSGFHETRDPRPETRLLPGAPRKPARVPRFFTNHETRITNHGLLSKHGFLLSQPSSIDRLPSEVREALHGWLRDPAITQTEAAEQPAGKRARRVSRQARGLRGGRYEARENEWKGVFLNPETGITTYTESGFGSRFGIPHYSSVFVAKIRISPCRPSSASAHCGNRVIGFMDVSRPRLTFPGPHVSPSGEVKGERATKRESRPFRFIGRQTFLLEQTRLPPMVFTKHESRNTNHGFFSKHGLLSASMPCPRLPTIARHCPVLLGKKYCPASVRAPSGVLVGPHGWPACLTTRRTRNELMPRKENVLACISHHAARRSA